MRDRVEADGFMLLEVVVALGVLAVALLPVARALADGVERIGRVSWLRGGLESARVVAAAPGSTHGGWTRVGATPAGLPCWGRSARVAADDVSWIWVEAACGPSPPGADEGGRPVRLLVARDGGGT